MYNEKIISPRPLLLYSMKFWPMTWISPHHWSAYPWTPWLRCSYHLHEWLDRIWPSIDPLPHASWKHNLAFRILLSMAHFPLLLSNTPCSYVELNHLLLPLVLGVGPTCLSTVLPAPLNILPSTGGELVAGSVPHRNWRLQLHVHVFEQSGIGFPD